MTNVPGRFALLPNVQTKLSQGASGHSTSRLSLSYDLEIVADGQAQENTVSVTTELRGPGDIIAVQSSQIARQEPARGQRGCEKDYFPFIEFVDVDFPWRYSFDSGGKTRKQPWLVLIALQPDEFESVTLANSPLPAIRVHSAKSSLPDLDQAWAFAHCQVNLDDTAEQLPSEVLSNDAASGFSRLLCPRRLKERQNYSLFLVPRYAVGVQAGLGLSELQSAPQPFDSNAWAQADNNVLLPYYYESRFSTDSSEDMEALLRRLHSNKANSNNEAGSKRQASASSHGYYSFDHGVANRPFDIQSALIQPGQTPGDASLDDSLAGKMIDTLQTVIKGETADEEYPLLSIPAYGFRFRQNTSVSKNRAQRGDWFDRINLDLPMRQAAAVGSRVVADNQELFSKLCWDQYEEVMAANQHLKQLRIAQELVKHLTHKHLAKLDASVTLKLAEPLHPFISDVNANGVSLNSALRNRGIAPEYAARDLRRQVAKRPFMEKDAAVPVGVRQVPDTLIPGAIESLQRPQRSSSIPWHFFMGTTRQSGILKPKGLSSGVKTKLNLLLGRKAFEEDVRPRTLGMKVQQFSLKELNKTIISTVLKLPETKAHLTLPDLLENERQNISPIYRSPSIPLPLERYLRETELDALLTNGSKINDNSVVVFEENRFFIESFMVGANHAINEELRWREFPTDMRGTVFRRFWNRGYSSDEVIGDDIPAIHQWVNELGSNHLSHDHDRENNLVVVIRGDIVRRLGNPIVVINEATGEEWKKGQGIDHEPVFFGLLDSSTAYFGFDVSRDHLLKPETKKNAFFVIYEAMSRLRFGLDVATAKVRQANQNRTNYSLPFPVGMLQRDNTHLPNFQVSTFTPPPEKPQSWDELSWEHMSLTDSGYIRFDLSIKIPGAADLWGNRSHSATLARSFWQKPVAGVLPLERVL